MTKAELEREYYFVHERSMRVHEEQEMKALSLMEEVEGKISGAFDDFKLEEGICKLMVESREAGISWEELCEKYFPKLSRNWHVGAILDRLEAIGILDACQEYLET